MCFGSLFKYNFEYPPSKDISITSFCCIALHSNFFQTKRPTTKKFFTLKTIHIQSFQPVIIIYPLTTRVVGAPQMISQSVSSISPHSPLPSETWQTPGLSIHSLMSSHLFLCLPYLLAPFTVPCKTVLARSDEQTTCPYKCSLHLFTMVRRSLCGPIACWILVHGLPH